MTEKTQKILYYLVLSFASLCDMAHSCEHSEQKVNALWVRGILKVRRHAVWLFMGATGVNQEWAEWKQR